MEIQETILDDTTKLLTLTEILQKNKYEIDIDFLLTKNKNIEKLFCEVMCLACKVFLYIETSNKCREDNITCYEGYEDYITTEKINYNINYIENNKVKRDLNILIGYYTSTIHSVQDYPMKIIEIMVLENIRNLIEQLDYLSYSKEQHFCDDNNIEYFCYGAEEMLYKIRYLSTELFVFIKMLRKQNKEFKREPILEGYIPF